MFSALCLAIAVAAPADTYNYTGKLTDLMTEGASWGMPLTGQPMTITIGDGGKASPTKFSLKAAKWKSEAPLTFENLKYADGALTGSVAFKNTSGSALAAVRFDVTNALERYKGKDKDGKEVILTRTLPLVQESPILFGDMPKDATFQGTDFKATGLAWKPETVDIAVTAKLSGLTCGRVLFYEHHGGTVDFDAKGRLYLGSGRSAAIYRADLDKETLDLVTSTPETAVVVAVSPTDGTINASWLNSHVFNLYTPSGDEKATIAEGEADGMRGWPQMGRFDGQGNLYLGFGSTIAKMVGDKPAFFVKEAGQFEFGGYVKFDVAKDGALFVGSESNIFRFDPGGKNGKKLIQGPSTKLGRTHGITAMRVDPNGYVWVSDETDGEFPPRACVYDANGRFVWVFGRGGPTKPTEGWLDGQLSTDIKSFAVSTHGRVFISNNEGDRSVMEFTMF